MTVRLPIPDVPVPGAAFDPARINPQAMEEPGRELMSQMDRASFLYARAAAAQAEKNAAAEAGNIVAQKRSQWTQNMMQMQRDAAPGAPDFTTTFMKAFNDDAKATVAGASDSARSFVESQMNNLGAGMMDHAFAFEQKSQFEKRSSDLNDMVRANANTVLTDASQFGGVMYETDRAINASGLPADAQRSALTSAHAMLSTAVVEGRMRDNPAEAKELLNGGDLDRFLPPTAKNDLLNRADAAILRNQTLGQATAAASVGRDYKDEIAAQYDSGQSLGRWTPEATRAAFPADQAEQMIRAVDEAHHFHEALEHVAPLTPQQEDEQRQILAPQGFAADPAIAQAAAKRGADPEALYRTEMLESGGNPNAVSTAGAKGPFQFTDATAAKYGLADPTDLAQSADAAARLQLDNKAALQRAGIAAPAGADLYLAHQQGAAGAAALIKNPNMNAIDALTPVYGGDRAKAAAAITQNGGSADMSAGAFADMWQTKYAQAAPGGDYGDALKRRDLYEQAIDLKHKQLAADPVGYVLKNFPEVQGAMMAAEQDPSKLGAALDLQDQLQTHLGVPPSQQRVLSASQATDMVQKLQTEPSDQAGAEIEQMAQQYGPRWQKAFGDLVDAKLPQSYQMLANVETPAARTELLNAMRTGDKALRAAVGPDNAKTIDKGLNDAVAPFLATLAPAPNGSQLGASWKNATQLLALRYANLGTDPATALQRAATDLFGAKYDIASGSGYNARAPKGTLGPVETFADAKLASLTPDQVWAPPSSASGTPLTDEQRQTAYFRDGISGRATWITAPDDQGWMLTDSAGHPVLDKSQTPIAFRFSDALKPAAPSVPPMAPDVPATGAMQ